MTNGLTIRKKETEDKKTVIMLDYRDYFDRNTREEDSFSDEFEFEEYRRGLKDLVLKGECSINGKYGTVSIRRRKSLFMTMMSGNESISIPIKREDLALS